LNPLKQLSDSGQSVWIDTITRDLLTSGTLVRYIEELSVTGLTSNPTIFEKAISGSADYDASIERLLGRELSTEDLFFELAIEDLAIAADHFRPVYERTDGVDGFVSLEVSPALANHAERTIEEAKRLHARANRENLLIKVPGTEEGIAAIEELIFAGVPVNVTLLFSTAHYAAAADAYGKGIERRVAAGRSAYVPSVASLFISRWDKAVGATLPDELRDRAGIAVGHRTYRAYTLFYESDRWQRLADAGARPQRLLWASTGTKNPELPDTYYVSALASAGTVNTMPEKTLLAFHDHGEVGELLTADASRADEKIEALEKAGVDIEAVAAQLQIEGRDAFVADFEKLLRGIEEKVAALK
jgi:transaldolase